MPTSTSTEEREDRRQGEDRRESAREPVPGPAPVFHFSFPPWLQQLLSLVVLLASLIWFAADIKSEQRSTREELTRVADSTKNELNRLAGDMQAIKTSLPNKELFDNRLSQVERQLEALESKIDVNAMMDQKLREDLLKRGSI